MRFKLRVYNRRSKLPPPYDTRRPGLQKPTCPEWCERALQGLREGTNEEIKFMAAASTDQYNSSPFHSGIWGPRSTIKQGYLWCVVKMQSVPTWLKHSSPRFWVQYSATLQTFRRQIVCLQSVTFWLASGVTNITAKLQEGCFHRFIYKIAIATHCFIIYPTHAGTITEKRSYKD